jgi:hypothetical protein
MHETKVYFVGVGPKSLALERLPDIKKKIIIINKTNHTLSILYTQ